LQSIHWCRNMDSSWRRRRDGTEVETDIPRRLGHTTFILVEPIKAVIDRQMKRIFSIPKRKVSIFLADKACTGLKFCTFRHCHHPHARPADKSLRRLSSLDYQKRENSSFKFFRAMDKLTEIYIKYPYHPSTVPESTLNSCSVNQVIVPSWQLRRTLVTMVLDTER
jgi:hypothetical protein